MSVESVLGQYEDIDFLRLRTRHEKYCAIVSLIYLKVKVIYFLCYEF